MSKYREEIAGYIADEIGRHPNDALIKDLRSALLKQRDGILQPPTAHHERIWMEEAHKAIQSVLKARRLARSGQSSLFEPPNS